MNLISIVVIIMLLYVMLLLGGFTPIIGAIIALGISAALVVPLFPRSMYDPWYKKPLPSGIVHSILMFLSWFILGVIIIVCYFSKQLAMFFAVYSFIVLVKDFPFYFVLCKHGKKDFARTLVLALPITLISSGIYSYMQNTGCFIYSDNSENTNVYYSVLYNDTTELPLNPNYKPTTKNVCILDTFINGENDFGKVDFGVSVYSLGHNDFWNRRKYRFDFSTHNHLPCNIYVKDSVSDIVYDFHFLIHNRKLAGVMMYDYNLREHYSDSISAYDKLKKSTIQFHRLFGEPKYRLASADAIIEKWETDDYVCYQRSYVDKKQSFGMSSWGVEAYRYIYHKKYVNFDAYKNHSLSGWCK